MRVLADENVPSAVLNALRRAGYDVFWVLTEAPGASDEFLLKSAQVEQRVVVTFDKDFGELAFRRMDPASAGILLIRYQPPSPNTVGDLVVAALESRPDWSGMFAVVEANRIRIVPLAPPP